MERCTASIFYVVIVFESGTRGSDPHRCPAGINNACGGVFVTAYSFSTVVREFLSFFFTSIQLKEHKALLSMLLLIHFLFLMYLRVGWNI